MKRFPVFLILLFSINGLAQAGKVSENPDTKYLEDQFYVGITYNFVLNKPEGITQGNLSYGLQGGLIKDIPINNRRNISFGVGLGYAVNSYYTDLRAIETATGIQYTKLAGDVSIKRNKIETHLIELPIEFRWRNSTATSYKFWRLYTGIKLGYIVGSRSKLVLDTGKISFYNTDTENFQYGLLFNFGFNTFNIHAYYALNDLFENGTVTTEGDTVGFTPFRIGIIFYIL